MLNPRQNLKIKLANRSFENAAKVQMFGNDSNKSEFDSGAH
jgi:hypothetical protein